MRKKLLVGGAAVLVAAGMLQNCGGDDPPTDRRPPAATTTPKTTAPSTTAPTATAPTATSRTSAPTPKPTSTIAEFSRQSLRHWRQLVAGETDCGQLAEEIRVASKALDGAAKSGAAEAVASMEARIQASQERQRELSCHA